MMILVHAHHVAALVLDPDLFHLQRRGIVPMAAFRMHLGIAVSPSSKHIVPLRLHIYKQYIQGVDTIRVTLHSRKIGDRFQ